nr:hypothetical protein [Bacillus sp. JFL15]
MSGRKERERAIAEMARVLKPGGTLAVSDIKNTSQYRKLLEENGFQTRTYFETHHCCQDSGRNRALHLLK